MSVTYLAKCYYKCTAISGRYNTTKTLLTVLGKFKTQTKHAVWWNSLCKEEKDEETRETEFNDEILNQCRTVSMKGGLGVGAQSNEETFVPITG